MTSGPQLAPPQNPPHRNLSLANLSAVFLRTDQGSAQSSAIEAANAASTSRCFTCNLPGHIAKNCPHAEAISRLLAQRTSNNGSGLGGGKEKGKGNARGEAAVASSTSNPTSSTSSTSHDSAGVASTSLSTVLRTTDGWICDSGATYCMSSDRSSFSALRPDRRQIRLADGKAIYSRGVSSIRLLSDYGLCRKHRFQPDSRVY